MDDVVVLIKCKRCGQEAPPHDRNPHLCDPCVKAEDSRVSYFRQHNFNWMDVSAEAGLDVWARQPAETDREYQVWLAYRDAYPSVKPSYNLVAQQLGTTLNVVRKVGQRWSFSARLQAWAKHCDELTLAQRQIEIVAMNSRHISMAERLSAKLSDAIDLIDIYTLKPNEIQGLVKMVAELERTARLDDPRLLKTAFADDNPEIKKAPTKTDDLNEVLEILNKAGVFNVGGRVGVRQTTTTEVVVKEE